MRRFLLLFISSIALSAVGSACSGGDDGRGPVKGRIVSILDEPVGFATLLVEGKDEPIQTDEDGRFSVDAPGTYDVWVRDPASNTVIGFLGLTDRTPHLRISWNVSGLWDGNVRVPILGGSTNTSSLVNVGTFHPDDPEQGGIVGLIGAGPTATQVSGGWRGAPSNPGTMNVLQYRRGPMSSDRRPVEFIGHVEAPVTLQAFVSDTSHTGVTLAPIGETQLTINTTPLAGFEPSIVYQVHAMFEGDTRVASLQTYQTVDPSLTWTTPDVAGATIRVVARQFDLTGGFASTFRFGNPPGGTVAVDFVTPPVLTTPAQGAGWTAFTPVSWTAMGGTTPAVYFLSIYDPALLDNTMPPPGTPSVFAVTTETSVTLPDLTLLGITVPSNIPYVVTLDGSTQFPSVDDYAVPYLQFVTPVDRYEGHSESLVNQ